MSQQRQPTESQPILDPSPLSLPAERLREPTPDEREIDVSDPDYDLPLDESERLQEDAETLKD